MAMKIKLIIRYFLMSENPVIKRCGADIRQCGLTGERIEEFIREDLKAFKWLINIGYSKEYLYNLMKRNII